MNAVESIVETGTPFVGLGRSSVAGGVNTIPINGSHCQQVGVLVYIEVGAGVTAADQVTVKLFAQNSTGVDFGQLDIDYVTLKTGAPLLNSAGVSGKMSQLSLGSVVGQTFIPATEYVTDITSGTKEIMLYVRARSRKLSTLDRIYIRANLASTNARQCTAFMFTEQNDAGPEIAPRTYHV